MGPGSESSPSGALGSVCAVRKEKLGILHAFWNTWNGWWGRGDFGGTKGREGRGLGGRGGEWGVGCRTVAREVM